MRTLIIVTLMVVLALAAITFGDRWETIEHPTPDVTVEIENNHELKEYKGSLSLDWHGNHILILNDGSRINVNDFTILKYPYDPYLKKAWYVHWRAHLPILLVLTLFFAVWNWLSSLFKRNKK